MNNNYLYIAYMNYIEIYDKSVDSFDKDDDNKKLQIIGYYDKKTNIWYNAWSFYDPINFNQYKKSKELLNYAINIDNNLPGVESGIKMIIKYILTNSKIYIEENIQLEIILSIIVYFLKAKKIKYSTNNKIVKYEVLI